MKILGLRVDGLRKLTAIEMEFADKGLIQFRGKNKQGKTTILDSFEILLKGAKHIEDDMITHDRKKAEIIGTIGDYEIKRVITTKSNRIEVKHKDNGAIGRPQEFLDTLINELTFNPRPFLNKTSEQKLRFMMDFLKIDFTAVDGKIANAETERLLSGRLIKKYGDLKPVEKVDRVNVADLVEKRNDITSHNICLSADYQTEKGRKMVEVQEFNEKQKELQRERSIVLEDLAELEATLRETQDGIEQAKQNLSDIAIAQPLRLIEDIEIEAPAYEDTADLDEQINQASDTNLHADRYTVYCSKKKEKAEEERKYEDYTTKLEKFRNVKKMIFRNAKIPIEGLEIREDGIYHNGIFSENWAESIALKISSELCLAMEPKLRALFLDEGESFDSDSLEELKNWAEKNDIQFFLSVVDSLEGESTDDTFYIVDGSVV